MTENETQPVPNTPPPLPAGPGCSCGHARPRKSLQPLLQPALHSRWSCLGLGLLGATQVSLTMRHVAAWPCPFFHLTGIPCPGCGATRACVALLRGHWAESLRMHALGSVFLGVIVLLLFAAMLPERPRRAFASAVEWFERRTGAGYVFFALLILYWIARLAINPQGYIRLMATPSFFS